MDLTITINMDNAAFEDDGGEVARILRDIAHYFATRGIEPGARPIRDVNGNAVGGWKVTR